MIIKIAWKVPAGWQGLSMSPQLNVKSRHIVTVLASGRSKTDVIACHHHTITNGCVVGCSSTPPSLTYQHRSSLICANVAQVFALIYTQSLLNASPGTIS